MVEITYTPRDEEYYTAVKLSAQLGDDATRDDHFAQWKAFMAAMTFDISGYELIVHEIS